MAKRRSQLLFVKWDAQKNEFVRFHAFSKSTAEAGFQGEGHDLRYDPCFDFLLPAAFGHRPYS